jgi:AraC-like DNA-binding protein
MVLRSVRDMPRRDGTNRTAPPYNPVMSRHSDGEPSDTTPHHRVGGYHEFAPPPDLADAVEALWTHQVAGVQVAVHRVVPDAAVSLCFMGLRSLDGASGAARLRVIGPVTTPQLFAPPIGHRMEALRVKLEWCRPVLGVAPWEHANAEPLYADVRPDLVEPLEARLMASRAPADTLRLMVAFVRERLARHDAAGGLLLASMESLRRGAGATRVSELARRLGVSERHLRRLMVDETGIAPRHFARIQRFHALLRASDLAPRPSWAALAADHGYADQSHLIREVQHLAGVSPTRLHEERCAE